MDYKFELAEQTAKPVLSIRTRTAVGNLPQEIGKAYQTIMQYLNEIGEKPSDVPFTAYYNMDMEDLDVEMGFPLPGPLTGKGEINSSEIPAGKQVSCLYKGPYNQMEPVYNALLQWVNENGYKPTGVSYEFYYNSPMEVQESELLTKVVFPLKESLNVCGLYCNDCPSFQKECNGCREVCGKVYWTEYIGEDICPLFKCCADKGIENCGKCGELPCKKWYDLKDPSLSDEEHLNSINKRASLLREDK